MATPSVSTSFKKKIRPCASQIAGTKVSLHNAQLLVSSGIPTLDYYIGGGIAVGSLILVEEDRYGTFGKLLLKYFTAEGIVSGHQILVCSGSMPPAKLLNELPAVVSRPTVPVQTQDTGDKLKIAWRYQNQITTEEVPCNSQFGHSYDLSKKMNEELLNNSNILLWSPLDKAIRFRDGWNLLSKPYAELLHYIRGNITSQFCATNSTIQHNVFRIAIHSLGTSLWNDDDGVIKSGNEVQFLFFLRVLLRTALAVALVTVPSHFFHAVPIDRMRQVSDTVVRLESFAGSEKETNPVYKDYHGLFKIIKLPRLNSLTCSAPNEPDLAFKLKKKKFIIEKLHLPPDLSETVSRSQGSTAYAIGGCAGGKSPLDF